MILKRLMYLEVTYNLCRVKFRRARCEKQNIVGAGKVRIGGWCGAPRDLRNEIFCNL